MNVQNLKYVMKFIKVNGKNLEEFYTDESNNALKLSIAKL